MNYDETCLFLFQKLASYQHTGAAALNKSLDKTLSLAAQLGNPQKKFKTIHIAGTNGKGSSAAMLTSVLMEAGYRVGTYTSPHLRSFTERIRVNGKTVEENYVVEFTQQIRTFIEQQTPSFFEITTLMAFSYFEQQKVDVAVIETGLGGKLDSTNIIEPEIALITNIGLDHQAILGNTLEKIAAEKAGIIKRGVPVVVSQRQPGIDVVFANKAQQQEADIIFASDEVHTMWGNITNGFRTFTWQDEEWKLSLLGSYQESNVKGVLAVINQLNRKGPFVIDHKSIRMGLEKTSTNSGIQGRWQVLGESPKIIADCGHNEDGIKIVLNQLREESYGHLYLIWGMVQDKDCEKILQLLPTQNCTIIFCQPKIERAQNAKKLQSVGEKIGLIGDIIEDVNEALRFVQEKANKNDIIFIGGSTFVIGELG